MYRVYHSSRYQVGSFTLSPGTRGPAWEAYVREKGAGSYTFITAYNPYSAGLLPRRENVARSQVLRQEVRSMGYDFERCVGVDPCGEWEDEPGLMVYDIPLGEVLALGRKWNQNAILYAKLGQAPCVLWCECNLA